MTPLQQQRLLYRPRVPDVLRELRAVHCVQSQKRRAVDLAIERLFPHTHAMPLARVGVASEPQPAHPLKAAHPLKVGVLFSGGPAPGGHNVLAALFDALQQIDPRSTLLGFLDGPIGLINNKTKPLQREQLDAVRNLGGFDLIGSGRDKIETTEQLAAAAAAMRASALDALVVIGGDDSNTNAALLAEYFLAQTMKTRVVGIPKTIDGDLRGPEIEMSFGFDSACKTYAELIGNLARDAVSSRKYYHFIKLMGRSASHIALECALATHPNVALLGEEKRPLSIVVEELAELVVRRAAQGKEYGVVLIPEGLIEFLPKESLPKNLLEHFGSLDAHGNVQLSQVPTEKLIIELVQKALQARKFTGKFATQEHFFGYEGRCCFPSNFDANYAAALGRAAALAIRDGLTGVIVGIQGLRKPPEKWSVAFVPLVGLMHMEERSGKLKPVIRKALVDLSGPAFMQFARQRKSWELDDSYQSPGPMQFFGEPALTDAGPMTL